MRESHPATGKSVFPTLDYSTRCCVRGRKTWWKRETANTLYIVLEGAGSTEIGGKSFSWEQNDLCRAEFLWRCHRNRGNADAVLYLCSDMPLPKKIVPRARSRAPWQTYPTGHVRSKGNAISPLATRKRLKARSMKLPRAILFDLDDTILVAFGPAQSQWRRTIASFAHQLGPIEATVIAAAIETASTELWSDPARHKYWRHRTGAARRRIVATAFTALAATGHSVPPVAVGDALADAYNALHDEELAVPGSARDARPA